MQEVKTEIEIAAPAATVWNILTDINRWSEWNPIVNRASGDAILGATLDISMCGKDGKDGPNYTPRIISLEEAKSFHWQAKIVAGFIFTNDKIIELEDIESGTRLVHKELFEGILAPLFCRNIEEGVMPMLNTMNEALKNLAEKREKMELEQVVTETDTKNAGQTSGEEKTEKEETPVT